MVLPGVYLQWGKKRISVPPSPLQLCQTCRMWPVTMVSGVLRELGWGGSRLPMQSSPQSLSRKFLLGTGRAIIGRGGCSLLRG